jgi:predicted SprT family Zn-dependent metalloprotease
MICKNSKDYQSLLKNVLTLFSEKNNIKISRDSTFKMKKKLAQGVYKCACNQTIIIATDDEYHGKS